MGAATSTSAVSDSSLLLDPNSIKRNRHLVRCTSPQDRSSPRFTYYEPCSCEFERRPAESGLRKPPAATDNKRVRFDVAVATPKPVMNSPFRGLRRSASNGGNAYPYPRTHTTVMVLPTQGRQSGASSRNGDWSSASSLADDSPTSSMSTLNFDSSNVGPSYGFERRRPPLNRAIPPIPESKSNESLMSQATKSIASTPCEPKQPPLELVEEVAEDKSVIIENKMAQNLAAKAATNVSSLQCTTVPANAISATGPKPSKLKQPNKILVTRTEPPKSPLLSMAHSVRSRLTKLGTKFGRSESRSPIRSSTSLISMAKPNPAASVKMAKSSSMEATRTTSTKQPVPEPATVDAVDAVRQTPCRSQITLMPARSRSPRPFLPGPPPLEDACTSEPSVAEKEETQLPQTKTLQDVPKQDEIKDLAQLTSPISNGTTMSSSNTDTVYSGQVSSSTRPLTSPDWSEGSNVKSAVVVPVAASVPTPAAAEEPIVEAAEPDVAPPVDEGCQTVPTTDAVDTALPQEESENGVVLDVNSNALAKPTEEVVPKTSKKEKEKEKEKEKSEKVKTPKLTDKIGRAFGSHGCKSSKSTKGSLPSPKVKPKKSASVNKLVKDEKLCGSGFKTSRKSIPFDASNNANHNNNNNGPDKVEVRRNSEMKFIKKLERTFVPLIPNSHSHGARLADNKNLDLRNMNVKSVNMRNRRAPLAEFESSRVENSPAVELPPIGFDRLTASPGQRRRAQAAAAARTVSNGSSSAVLMTDSNGNVVAVEVSEETCVLPMPESNGAPSSPPQLVAEMNEVNRNAASMSVISDGLSGVDGLIAAPEKKTIESAAALTETNSQMTVAATTDDSSLAGQRRDKSENGVRLSEASTSEIKTSGNSASDHNANKPCPDTDAAHISRDELRQMKSQLYALKDIISESTADGNPSEKKRVEELSCENEFLRRQLEERDRQIEALREQLTSSANVHS